MGLKELIQSRVARVALLPERNDLLLTDEGRTLRGALGKVQVEDLYRRIDSDQPRYMDLSRLDDLDGYTVPLIAHDYGALTPAMWNAVYDRFGIPIRSIMLVADPNNADEIFGHLKADERYLGGGAGVGFKEKAIPHLEGTVPPGLKAINLVLKSGESLLGYNTDADGFVRSLEEKFALAERSIEGSVIIVIGAGGVAKEVVELIAQRKPKAIRIVNRTVGKAVALAHEINQRHGDIAVGLGEEMTRGVMLNSYYIPDAVINLSDKGSDGTLENTAAFAVEGPDNVTLSRTNLRELSRLNPKVIIADITLPRSGRSISLRLADMENVRYLLDGKPMVVYQAVPAYGHVQREYPEVHTTQLSEQQILETMRAVAGL